MTSSHTARRLCHWFPALAAALDRRSAPRLARLLLGAILACGRRTVTSWIRAAGLSPGFRPCYTTVSAAGKRADGIAARLAHEVVKPLVAGMGRVVFALDDTPTPRYGPLVQGAGVHHNPCPGPANTPFVYGHVWVVLGLLATHPAWGVIALPLLARLYVRRKDLPATDEPHRPTFRTKLELAVELVRWAKCRLGFLGKPLWVVADGAYAKAALLKPLTGLGVVVVSRLRGDAALRTVPVPRTGGRGRPRKYGGDRISLAKRAGQRRGWATGTFELYGKRVAKRYKTFVATWRPAGGVIRVVLVDEPKGWVAFFCTDRAAGAADILGLVADRFSLETTFRDCKGGRRCRAAAGPSRVGERGFVPPVPVDVHDDRVRGVGPGRGRVGGPPEGVAVGRQAAPPEPRGQAAGLAAGVAGERNWCGSEGRGRRRGNPRPRPTPPRPRCLNVMKSRKVPPC